MPNKSLPKIILASNSPRRRELLGQVGLTFTIDPADVDERVMQGESPETYALRVAADKARVVVNRAGQGIVIAADTIVVLGDAILGKPVDAGDAARMLRMLSGHMHRVITGLAIMNAANGRTITRTVSTRVWFRELSSREIDSYVESNEPLDKAGAYGIQEKGALLVERIEGCYFNVVGLPLVVLGEMLKEFGINLL